MAAAPLLEVGVMFAVLALAGAVAHVVGQSVIPFYILAGIAAGPGLEAAGLPAVRNGEFVQVMALLGIVFLLFFLGLEFSPDRLVESGPTLTKAGLVDLAVNLPVGVVLGLALGWSALEALLLGGIVYISSSAVITKSLIDLGWIANAESEPILGTLVFEDLFMAVFLAVMSVVVLGESDPSVLVMDVGVALAFLGLLVLVVYYGTDWFERALAAGTEELFVLRAVGVTVFVAGVALAVGVSEAVAAFFVGMAFSATGHVEGLERTLSPLRDVFAAVFFFWIGLTTDPTLFVGVAGLLAVAVVATTATKLVSGFAGGRLYGLDDRRSVRVGTAMVTRGEFSLVIAALAASGTGPVLTRTIPAFAVGYVLLMSTLGTGLMQYAHVFEGVVGAE